MSKDEIQKVADDESHRIINEKPKYECGPNISQEQLESKRSLVLAVEFETGHVLSEGKTDEEVTKNMANTSHDSDADNYYLYAVPAKLTLPE